MAKKNDESKPLWTLVSNKSAWCPTCQQYVSPNYPHSCNTGARGAERVTSFTEAVLRMVRDERYRQDEKWGEQNHTPDRWLAILGEEFGEACKGNLEGLQIKYVTELIEAAAVAVAAVESCWRQAQAKAVPQ